MGSSRPNLARSASRTSGGTLGLVASSENGSPGASASTMNRISEIPSRLGMAISRRRRMYWLMTEAVCPPPSRLPVPFVQVVGFVGPAGQHWPQRVGGCLDLQAMHRGNEHGVLPHDVVGLDVERRALDG